jgi:hypothetical protein
MMIDAMPIFTKRKEPLEKFPPPRKKTGSPALPRPTSCLKLASENIYCCGALDAPIFVPITSPEIMISTLRFCCRPAGVSLLATGFDFPNPVALIEFGASPCVIK